MNLFERYQEMTKQAEENVRSQSQIEVLQKFASAAESLLQEQGQEYTADDVVKVASFLIDAQLEEEEQQEKVAEAASYGRIMAREFLEEVKNNA